MPNVRRSICFFFLIAVFTRLAGAQQESCSAQGTVSLPLRGEGFTEQTGDLIIACAGGIPLAPGANIPLITFTVFYNTTVTSRLLPTPGDPTTNHVSDALLLIDEPNTCIGCTVGTSPPVSYGSTLPLIACLTPFAGCVQTVGAVAGPTYGTAVSSGSTPAPNVYQGVVSGNSVTFNGVPVLPPGASGTRVYRITNVLVNAQAVAGGGSGTYPVQSYITVSGAASLPISNSEPIVGYIQTGLTASAGSAATVSQCASQTKVSATTLTFSENFGTAFKTRIFAQSSSLYAGQVDNSIQNVPGGIYNSESGFVFPIPGTSPAQVTGLSDFGTRLKATFHNVPSGVHIFVSTANVIDNATPAAVPSPVGGSQGNANPVSGAYTGYAQLVNSESVNDGAAGAFPSVAATGSAGTVPIAEVSISAGTGSAVWEVVNTDPNLIENFKFAVYITYTANFDFNSPLPGTSTVNLSFAATSTSGNAAGADTPLPRFAGDSSAARDAFVIGACTVAPMTTPAPGAGLTGSTTTFTWSAGSGASAYWLDVGTARGQGNIFAANVGLVTSRTVSGIPINGGTIYVRLWTQLGGTWYYNDYTYTATSPLKAAMSTPAPGSVLGGSTTTFTWSAGSGASAYWLDVGTAQGQGNIFGGNVGLVTNQVVNGIPTNGSTIYVRLWTQLAGVWQYYDYTYTAASSVLTAVMLTPAPGSVLTGSTTTFTWSAGIGASAYWLDVGTAQGQGNIFAANVGLITSQAVNGIPTNGGTIYVRLWTQRAGVWQYSDYTYTAASGGITTPVPGSVLSSPSATFNWTAVAGADQYWVDVGSTVGIGDYFGGATTGTSASVNSLPCDTRTVYVQLWAHIGGSWQTPLRYTYTAAAGCAALTSPANNVAFTGTSANFTWNAIAGADQYWLDVGNSIGVGDIFGGGTTSTNVTVNNMPCDGRSLYGQVWTHSGGSWHGPGRYNFTAWGACGRLTTPSPGATLPGSTVAFNWNAGTGVMAYWLDVGTVLGQGNLFGANVGTALSQAVTDIPTNGSVIYVQLWSQIGGVWYPNRYSYTAFH
jgi:hypothetical protein